MSAEELERGLAHYRAQRFDEAQEHFCRATREAPGSADAHHLLGLATWRSGDPEAAIDVLDRAISLDPDHGPARANRALVSLALGRTERAEADLRRAIALLPHALPPRLRLGRLLLDTARPAQAVSVGRAILEEHEHPEAFEILGVALHALGDLSGAREPLARATSMGRPLAALVFAQLQLDAGEPEPVIPVLRALVERAPELEQAAVLLARALRDTGDLQGALRALGTELGPLGLTTAATLHEQLGDTAAARAALERAVLDRTDDGAAWHNLARLRSRDGEIAQALHAHLRALACDPTDRSRWIALIDTVSSADEVPTDVAPWLVRALDQPGVGVQGVERALRRFAEASADEAAWTALLDRDAVSHELLARLDRPLIHGWWRKTRVVGPVWERRLTALRRADLLHDALQAHPALRLSLALQALHTQHAWAVRDDERAALAELDPSSSEDWPRIAAYRSLPPTAEPPHDAALALLYRVAVAEPVQERRLATEVPRLGMTDDPTSRAVRAQYEEHPYPRLLSVHHKPPARLPALLRQIAPTAQDLPDPDPVRILIAGCGTGQQVIAARTRYRNPKILAIDLSRASLGVAARQLAARGLSDGVRLAQADLLALTELDEVFDVVECGGVLHHLAKPVAGLRVLVERLGPRGLLKLGVYSERARADVVAARELLAQAGVGASDDEIRRGRQLLLDLPCDHPAYPVVWSPDFSSLSGARDLLLHACEHRYTLERLDSELRAVGLEVLAFQHADARPSRWYAERFPGDLEQRDLERWAGVEHDHPECFRGMYQLWCRRPTG